MLIGHGLLLLVLCCHWLPVTDSGTVYLANGLLLSSGLGFMQMIYLDFGSVAHFTK